MEARRQRRFLEAVSMLGVEDLCDEEEPMARKTHTWVEGGMNGKTRKLASFPR